MPVDQFISDSREQVMEGQLGAINQQFMTEPRSY
jgi:hypothetical protein